MLTTWIAFAYVGLATGAYCWIAVRHERQHRKLRVANLERDMLRALLDRRKRRELGLPQERDEKGRFC